MMALFLFICTVLLVNLNCFRGEEDGIATRDNKKLIACPADIINTTGVIITSPLYPNYYPPYFYCNYLIQAPEGEKIVLNFEDFSFPERPPFREAINYCVRFPECSTDYLEIAEGENYKERYRYCGGDLSRKKFQSRGSTLKLTLQTMTSSELYRGFKAVISFEKIEEKQCTTKKGRRGKEVIACKIPFDRRWSNSSTVKFLVQHRTSSGETCEVVITRFGTSVDYKTHHIYGWYGMEIESLIKGCPRKYAEFQDHLPPYTPFIDYYYPKEDESNYNITITEISTEQKTVCGGNIVLENEPNQTYKINISIGQLKCNHLACLWIFTAPYNAEEISIDVTEFYIGESKNDCDYNFLSMMYVSANKYLIMEKILESGDTSNINKMCSHSSGRRVFGRLDPEGDIYGPLSVMVLMSSAKSLYDEKVLRATVSYKLIPRRDRK